MFSCFLALCCVRLHKRSSSSVTCRHLTGEEKSATCVSFVPAVPYLHFLCHLEAPLSSPVMTATPHVFRGDPSQLRCPQVLDAVAHWPETCGKTVCYTDWSAQCMWMWPDFGSWIRLCLRVCACEERARVSRECWVQWEVDLSSHTHTHTVTLSAFRCFVSYGSCTVK